MTGDVDLSAEAIEYWRNNVRELREWCVEQRAKSVLIEWEPAKVIVFADGRARAVLPDGTVDLTTEKGLAKIAAHTDLIDGPEDSRS